MAEAQILKTLQSALKKKMEQNYTGRVILEINLNQGGIGSASISCPQSIMIKNK